MSGTHPTADAPGFTLLELVVVLAILGLAAALAAPSLMRSVETWQAAAQVDRLAVQIEGLPARARARGRPIVLGGKPDPDPDADAPLVVEPGWTVSIPEPWTVQANGFCEGGEVVLRHEEREWVVRAVAPFCAVEPADA